jgi:lipopolysaccharide export system ATP-binding protein
VPDLLAWFWRLRAPPPSRRALDTALGVGGRFDLFAFFRRRPAGARWVDAPALGRRTRYQPVDQAERYEVRRRSDDEPRWNEPAPFGDPEPARFPPLADETEVAARDLDERQRWDETHQPDDGHVAARTPGRQALWDQPEQGSQTDADPMDASDDQWERERRWSEAEQEQPEGYLAVAGAEKSFAGRKVVKGVSLYVRRGEAVGLLGPNGAGKTTVFYMITGLVKADRGRIELDGHDITGLPMYQRGRLGIGYLPQEASIFRGLTVEQNIRAVLEVVEPNRRKREAELDELLEEFNIARLRKTPSIALSGGERRRVEIARALATRPSYMLLDEPFAGIDPIAVGDIQALVRHLTQRGIGVLITDHNVRETLGLTDRSYIIYSGEVLMEGNTADIVNDPEVRRLYLGEEFRL